MESFITHLATLLACYETSEPFSTNRGGVGSSAGNISYDGPSDARTDSITRSVSALVSRMWKAEEALTKYESRFKEDIPQGEGRAHSVTRVEKADLNRDLESGRVECLTNEKCTSFDGQLVEEMTRVCNGIAGGDLSEKVTGSEGQDRALIQLKDAMNNMVDECVTTAVAQGDLTQKLEIQCEGKAVSTVKSSINSMMDQLSAFVSHVAALESFGLTCHPLGGANQVQFHGIWAKLTDDLTKTKQVTTNGIRSIFAAIKAVALGDLTKHVEVQGLQGELLDLKSGVNGMIDWLSGNVNEAIQILSEVAEGGNSLGAEAGKAHGFDRVNVRGVWKILIDTVDAVALKVDDGRPKQLVVSKDSLELRGESNCRDGFSHQ